jgi:hypothetical protein
MDCHVAGAARNEGQHHAAAFTFKRHACSSGSV